MSTFKCSTTVVGRVSWTSRACDVERAETEVERFQRAVELDQRGSNFGRHL